MEPPDPRQLIQAGIAHHQAGRLPEAEALYRQVLARFPRHPDALHMLGVLAHHAGRHDLAVDLINQAIRITPRHAACYNNLGNAERAQGQLDAAIRSYRKALSLSPSFADAHQNLGLAFQAKGQFDKAIASLKRALALRPDSAASQLNLANVLVAAGRLDEAREGYERVLATEPNHADALNNIGLVLAQQHRVEEAVAAIRKALAVRPDYAEAWLNLGTQLEAGGDMAEALRCYERAVDLKPNLATAHNNQGNALLALGRLDESGRAYERALALRPDYGEAYANLGNLWQTRGEIDRAVACYDRMLELAPASPVARWNKAFALLLKGDFANGWALYESRWEFDDPTRVSRAIDAPLWLGDAALEGRTLLLHHEQGLGDTLQMLRYVPVLAERGARVLVQVPSALAIISATVPGVAGVIVAGEVPPAVDLHTPFMSLPLATGTTLAHIPGEVPYLFAGAQSRAAWRERLGTRQRRRIGLVWSGSTTHRNDRQRSIRLARLLPLLDADVEFISLQKECRAEDLELMRRDGRIRDVAGDLGDFADTAALLAELDLLITVDTSVAHLAGALGCPTWLLLPFAPDYRWLLGRADSPWYPSLRLFRQPALGDWESVVRELAALLDAKAG